MCSYWMFLDYLFFFDHLFFMVTPPRKIGLQICFLQKKFLSYIIITLYRVGSLVGKGIYFILFYKKSREWALMESIDVLNSPWRQGCERVGCGVERCL